MIKRWVKAGQGPILALLRGVGRFAVFAPRPPRATGGYGLACRGALILLFLIGLLLTWPARGLGLVVMIVAALALMQFFALQYRGAVRGATAAWLLAVAVLLGVVIGVVWSRWGDRDGASGDVMVLGAGVGALVALAAVRSLFRTIFGPHHPESTLPEPDDPPPLWFWVGGVGPNEATIVARLAKDTAADSVVVEYHDQEQTHRSAAKRPDGQRFVRIPLTDLEADRLYDLRVIAVGGDQKTEDQRTGETSVRGSFTTFPAPKQPATVTMAFASCMSTGSKGQVFDTIGAMTPRPRIFVVTGDLHYENITSKKPERFLEAYDQVHSSHSQRRLYNSMPMAYVWDDHDFGDNDSGHGSPSKGAAQKAYRMAVPSYLTAPEGLNTAESQPTETAKTVTAGPIHQAFSIARVRVIMTDNRSERGEHGKLLNSSAEEWLIEQILDPQWPLVIWVSPTPWISSKRSSDNWGAYPDQRERIANAIAGRNANLLMVSGDAHMVAIDDGSNSDYSTTTGKGPGKNERKSAGVSEGTNNGGSGFPVLQAAALDRLGSAKGGPFSHGRFSAAGQFGTVTVDDRGDEIEVELCGWNWMGSAIVKHSYTVDLKENAAP